MPNIQNVLCWFEANSVKYGPANCELIEKVEMSARGIDTISYRGTFELEPEAKSLMPQDYQDYDMTLWLEDGRQADILITSVINGQSGSFVVRGDFK